MIVVRAPQLNVNDEEVTLVEWLKGNGQEVKKGEVVGVIETSKATAEIEAERNGYFRPIAKPGDRVRVGAILCVLTDTPDEPLDQLLQEEVSAADQERQRESFSRRWTKKAELLAREYGINIEEIPGVGVIREADVEKWVKERVTTAKVRDLVDDLYPDNRATRVLLVGGGEGAVLVCDVLWRSGRLRPVGIVDDDPRLQGKTVMGVKVLGTTEIVPELLQNSIFDAAVITFGRDLDARARMFEKLTQQGVQFVNVIDPLAQIGSNVALGTGNVIIGNSRIGPCCRIGNNNFISAFVNLEHHNVLGSHCTFGPGVMTSGRVIIGDKVRFGTGIFIEPGIRIGSGSIIASGSTVTADVPPNSVVKSKITIVVRRRGENT